MTDQAKTPEQEAAEAAAAAAAAAEAKKAEKAAAKAAKDAEKAATKEAADAAKAAKKAEKDAAAEAKKTEKAAKDAEKAAKKAAKEAAKGTPAVKQNGIALPKEGTIGHTLFTIFNTKSAELGQPCDVTSVIPVAEAQGVCLASIRAGYAKWKKFHGLTGRIAAPAAPAADGQAAA